VRLATATRADGTTICGPVRDGALHDVTTTWEQPARLVAASVDPVGRAEIEAVAEQSPATPLADLRLLPPVPAPARIICVGVNYAEHAAESGRTGEPPGHPVLFSRFAASLVGHGSPIVRPSTSTHYDYEGELAVVIGRRTRHVRPAEALGAVAGYSCLMDGTLRDYQRHTSQFLPGKNFDRSGAWGPWIVTADEIDDPSALELTTTVSGEVLQSASTADMIHDVAHVVSYCSEFTTLEPGDVIATGTPAGVGFARTPPRWLVPGDEVRVTIDRIGALVNEVVDEESDGTS
jgi:2-keto-4-pentenoate hydratase/2-oxohepta-3-ene-1,7-dioic acid hydratase in catechol pathway